MKNRESSPVSNYENSSGKITIEVNSEISDVDIDVTNVKNLKNLKSELVSNEEYLDTDYETATETLPAIVSHAHNMMKVIEQEQSIDTNPGEIRTLLNIKETMDLSMDIFDGWSDYENPAGTDSLYRLLGAAPLAFLSQETIIKKKDEIEGRPNERSSYRLEVAEFGSRLLDVIDTNPDMSVKELVASIADTVVMFADVDERSLEKFINDKIRGARSEYTFKKAFDNAPGSTLKDPTAWEDLRGIDFVLDTHRNAYNIDVKSSQRSVMKVAGDHEKDSDRMYAIRKAGSGENRDAQRIVIWPGTTDDMFKKDSFELKEKYEYQVSQNIQNAIHAAKNEYDRNPQLAGSH